MTTALIRRAAKAFPISIPSSAPPMEIAAPAGTTGTSVPRGIISSTAQLTDDMLRWQEAPFGPGLPLEPWFGWQNLRGKPAQEEPRTFDYVPSVNVTIAPRLAYGLMGFSQLKYYMDGIPENAMLRRMMIEEMKGLQPVITDQDGNPAEDEDTAWMTTYPDRYTAFPMWLSRFLDDVITYDAGAVLLIRGSTSKVISKADMGYEGLFEPAQPWVCDCGYHCNGKQLYCPFCRRPIPLELYQRKLATIGSIGVNNLLTSIKFDEATRYPETYNHSLKKFDTTANQVTAMRIIDGSTLLALIDERGEQPAPPAPAFTQIIRGTPFLWLTTEQLWYRPRQYRLDAPYGRTATEDALRSLEYLDNLWTSETDMYCYDDQTEILSKRGWVKFPDLVTEDEVATLSPIGSFEWQKPEHFNDQPFNGNMIHFKNNVVDLMVTPNHRMLVRRFITMSNAQVDRESFPWHIERADSFLDGVNNPRYFEMPAVSNWEGISPEAKHLVSPPFEFPNHPHIGDIDIPIRAWLGFLGLFLSEGCVHHKPNHGGKGQVEISQSPKSNNLSRIKEILDSTGLNWSYNPKSMRFSCYHRALVTEMWKYGKGAANKHLPVEEKVYSPELLKCLIEGMMLGDGHHDGHSWSYTTISHQLAGDLQEVMQKCGYNASMSYYPRIIYKHSVSVSHYEIRQKKAKTHGVPKPIAVSYSGHIYCVNVPNGIIYVRRNGKSIWSGNTEGNVPEMILTAPIEWSDAQCIAFEKTFNSRLAGQLAEKRRIRVIPAGFAKIDTKGTTWNKEGYITAFERLSYCHGFPLSEIGKAPGTGLGGRGMQEEGTTQHYRQGIAGMKGYVESLFNDILAMNGKEGYEFELKFDTADIDSEKHAQQVAVDWQNGGITRNEYRGERGYDPIKGSAGDVFMMPAGKAETPSGQAGGDNPPASGKEPATAGATPGQAGGSKTEDVQLETKQGEASEAQPESAVLEEKLDKAIINTILGIDDELREWLDDWIADAIII